MDVSVDELLGENVRIVPMERDHIEGLFEAGSDELIWAHLPKSVKTIEEMEAFVDEALNNKKSGTSYPFVILLRKNNKVIGTTRFLGISPLDKGLEIGWTWLTSSVWGTQINAECKYILLKHCFETINTIRVQLITDEKNLQSQKAIEKIGGIKEGISRNHKIRENGTYRNSVVYSIIESEWPSVKRKLENMINM